MELSIREAKARFAAVAAAAAQGERVVITKRSKPFIELVPARPATGFDPERAAQVRKELGLDGVTLKLPDNFDDPAFSRAVLGLTD